MDEIKAEIKKTIIEQLEAKACELGLFDMDVIEEIAERKAVEAINDLIHSKKLWRKFRRARNKLFDKIKRIFR